MAPAYLKTHVLCTVLFAALASAAPAGNSSAPVSSNCTAIESKLDANCFLVGPEAEVVEEGDQQRFKQGLIDCPCSPTKSGATANATAIFSDIRELIADLKKNVSFNLFGIVGDIIGGMNFQQKLRGDMQDCFKLNSVEACVNADKALRSKIESICTYDPTTGANLYNNGTKPSKTYVTLLPCDRNPTYALKKEAPVNEGCVAVEHLKGYVLQHASHLLRPVLCSNGFCATPNHAIIVKGEMTSMKQLCGSGRWECVEQVRLVNNLKISANRRAKISDEITVTPYDVRFPKAVIWAVQMAEDLWNMLALSVCTGTLAGIAILLISTAETKN